MKQKHTDLEKILFAITCFLFIVCLLLLSSNIYPNITVDDNQNKLENETYVNLYTNDTAIINLSRKIYNDAFNIHNNLYQKDNIIYIACQDTNQNIFSDEEFIK